VALCKNWYFLVLCMSPFKHLFKNLKFILAKKKKKIGLQKVKNAVVRFFYLNLAFMTFVMYSG